MASTWPILLDNVYSTVQAGSSAIGSSSATGINVATGDGANFGTIGTNQYIPAVIVDTSTSPETIKEYVWITAISTDALTVTRQAEESTRYPASTTSIQAGYTIAAVSSVSSRVSNLLGKQVYAPGTSTLISTTSSSLSAVDSTNATVAFTTRPSGLGSTAVLVRVALQASALSGGVPTQGMTFALFTHGTSTQVGNSLFWQNTTATQYLPAMLIFSITGLSPSTGYQYDLAFSASGSGPPTALVRVQGTTGGGLTSTNGSPLVMEVHAA